MSPVPVVVRRIASDVARFAADSRDLLVIRIAQGHKIKAPV
jgi:hypothetical protein